VQLHVAALDHHDGRNRHDRLVMDARRNSVSFAIGVDFAASRKPCASEVEKLSVP